MQKNKSKKIGIGALVAVFVGYTCSVTSIPNGAIIGQHTYFHEGTIGIIIAFGLATLISTLTSYIGYKTGKNKDVIFKTVFGKHGFLLCSLIFTFCQAFWACYDFFNAGQALYNLMPDGFIFKNLGFCIAVAILLVLTIVGGLYGMKGVAAISTATIPVAIILFIIIYAVCLGQAGGFAGLQAYIPTEHTLGIAGSAQIMFGMWMAAYIGMIDLTTEAKNAKAVFFACLGGAAFIMLCFFVGQVGFVGTTFKTIGDICLSLGGAIFIIGNLFVIVAQGNTTPAACYMYTISFSESLRLSRKTLAIIVPCIVAVVSFVIMYGPGVDFINNITSIISTLMGPIIGVIIAEFYLISKCNMKIGDAEHLPSIQPAALLSLVIGVALSFVFSNVLHISLHSLLTIGITLIMHLVLAKGFKLQIHNYLTENISQSNNDADIKISTAVGKIETE